MYGWQSSNRMIGTLPPPPRTPLPLPHINQGTGSVLFVLKQGIKCNFTIVQWPELNNRPVQQRDSVYILGQIIFPVGKYLNQFFWP